MTVRAKKARRLTPKQAMRELDSVFGLAESFVLDTFSSRKEILRVHDQLVAAATAVGVADDHIIVCLRVALALAYIERLVARNKARAELGLA